MDNNEKLFIQKRVNSIQKKYNFNPDLGAKQVINSSPAAQRAFGEFSLLKNIIYKFNIDIDVAYDKTGLGQNKTLSKPKQICVYIASKDRNTWKIGFSQNAYERVRNLQTGNEDKLTVKYTIPGGRELEYNLKEALRKYKTRARNKTHENEWFLLTTNFVKELVRYLNDNEFDYSKVKELADKLNRQ